MQLISRRKQSNSYVLLCCWCRVVFNINSIEYLPCGNAECRCINISSPYMYHTDRSDFRKLSQNLILQSPWCSRLLEFFWLSLGRWNWFSVRILPKPSIRILLTALLLRQWAQFIMYSAVCHRNTDESRVSWWWVSSTLLSIPVAIFFSKNNDSFKSYSWCCYPKLTWRNDASLIYILFILFCSIMPHS